MNLCKKGIVLVVCCLVALMTSPVDAQGKKESKAAVKFRTQGEQAGKAIEQVRGQLEKTLQAYEELLSAKDKKLQSAHKKLVGELDKTDKMVQSGKKQVQAFQEGAETFFAMWETNLSSISTASIQDASRNRLEAARAKAQNMADNLTSAKESYEPLMSSLNEQATLLNQDLSPDTVAMMREDVAPDVRAKGEQVLASLDRVLNNEQAHEAAIDEILDEEQAETPEETLEDPDAQGEETGSEETVEDDG